MPAKQQGDQARPVDQNKLETLNEFIEEQVIRTLGKPSNLIKVQIRPIWDNHFRVNVLVGVDAASAKVANSYFLVVDTEGAIIGSTPKLGKVY